MLLWHFEGEAKKYERLLQCVEVFHAYGVGSDECVGVSVWGIESNNPEDCCSDISFKVLIGEAMEDNAERGTMRGPHLLCLGKKDKDSAIRLVLIKPCCRLHSLEADVA